MTASSRVKVLALVFAMFVAGACKKKQTPVGATCERDYQCDYMKEIQCIEGKCSPRRPVDARCSDNNHCATFLCVDKTCVSVERKAQLDAEAAAREAEAKRKVEVEKEQRLLKEGGIIDTAPIAEVPNVPTALPPGPGQRVRTVSLTAKGSSFAPCKPTERLIGGGCRTSATSTQESYPSHHGAEDTMGARWNCKIENDTFEVTAYALCQKP